MLKVLREELAYREAKRKNRLIKQAGFTPWKPLKGTTLMRLGCLRSCLLPI